MIAMVNRGISMYYMDRIRLVWVALFLTGCNVPFPTSNVSAPTLPVRDVVRVVPESIVECSTSCERAAVVFIHGLLGSHDTWKNGTAYWPALLTTDPNLGNKVDVYRVDYDSYMFSAGPSLGDVLKEVQAKLDPILLQPKYRRVFLIGHSLGGNVARSYLMHIKTRYGHPILSKFRITYTLGTPMLGSSLATVASFASSNQHLRVLLPIKVNDFQQSLNMTMFDVTKKAAVGICPGIYIHTAYETQPMGAAGIVVDEASATAYSNHKQGFARNHSNLVKPVDRNDEVYLWVANSMQSCLKNEGVCERDITPQCLHALANPF